VLCCAASGQCLFITMGCRIDHATPQTHWLSQKYYINTATNNQNASCPTEAPI